MSSYITVAIPYVNSTPHPGYAFELIEADLVARARRELGESIRFLGGTDEFSLKNVLAAEREGRSVRDFVDVHADRFAALADDLVITFDDFIRTSRDPRHRPAVERLWRACGAAGDLYRRDYEGHYCVGCEQFYDEGELDDGRCPEHGAGVEIVAETNWFFRLSRFGPRLLELIESGRLVVEPEPYRRDVIAFVRRGLRDISVSRSVTRARGWGIPVPGDPSQVVYVWFDALTNYISALGFGDEAGEFDHWWCRSDARIHVVGKGIVRFHAVYWPAFLLSAGLPLPTRVHVHPYLTADGRKLSKSDGTHDVTSIVDPGQRDRLRWWCARSVSPTSDTDYSAERVATIADDDLANGLGNAVGRVASLIVRHRDGRVPHSDACPVPEAGSLPRRVASALAEFDRRSATAEIVAAVDAVNRYIEATAPWQLARDIGQTDELDRVLGTCVSSLASIAEAIEPITPDIARRILERLDRTSRLADTTPVVPRVAR